MLTTRYEFNFVEHNRDNRVYGPWIRMDRHGSRAHRDCSSTKGDYLIRPFLPVDSTPIYLLNRLMNPMRFTVIVDRLLT